MEMTGRNVGIQVREWREFRNLTQEGLAQKLHTKQESISRLEKGSVEPSLRFLRRVARALDVVINVHLEGLEGK